MCLFLVHYQFTNMNTIKTHDNKGIPYSIRKQLHRGWVEKVSVETGFSKSLVRKVSIGNRKNAVVQDAILNLFEEQQKEKSVAENRLYKLLNQ